MKKYFCSLLLICIVAHLFANEQLRERIHVQTDKRLYLAGEMVLMKILTTDAALSPIVFSKVAYAELVDDSIARVQIKIELTNGTGSGFMHLPLDLPTGYYRLIAYTRYMRNEGAEVFFEKDIAVLNTFLSGYYPIENETEPKTQDNFFATFSLQTDKQNYSARERGELILTGLPENIHTLSVSIAGNEYKPNVSSFQNNQPPNSTRFTGDFFPEYEGHVVTGTIINNQTDTPISGATPFLYGLAFPGDEIRYFSGQKSSAEEVMFFTSGISDTKEAVSIVYNAGENYRVDIHSPFVSKHLPRQMPVLHINSEHYRQILARSVALQASLYFSSDPRENKKIPESFFKMQPSQSYPLDDYARFGTMREVFVEFIRGARFRRNDGKQELSILFKTGASLNYGNTPLVIVDGIPVNDHDEIFNYDPLSVEQINLYYGPFNMGGARFDGIIELITYNRLHQGLYLNKSTQLINYESPQSPLRLHELDYTDIDDRNSRIPDARHTLLWNPEIKTDGKNSIKLPFDTSDFIGEFQVTVEGITIDGDIVFATSFFKVIPSS